MTWTIQTTDLRRRVREVLDRVRVQREPVVASGDVRPTPRG
jgi:PHD/YefM family antitoxin component YafN of YafNO toxin-antitoxin module